MPAEDLPLPAQNALPLLCTAHAASEVVNGARPVCLLPPACRHPVTGMFFIE